jgi:hypothetical protein
VSTVRLHLRCAAKSLAKFPAIRRRESSSAGLNGQDFAAIEQLFVPLDFMGAFLQNQNETGTIGWYRGLENDSQRSKILMSIERAEKLKDLLTDKFVVVDASVPELRRFQNWTGKVRTVNMNCRALVEFDGPVDIGWYDIDPDYLKVVDAPVKKVPAPVAKAAPAEAKPAAAAPKPAAPAGKSPLDAIRAQQAAKAAGTAPAAVPVGAKPSPLDLIRKQQAAKAAAAPAAVAAAPVVESVPVVEPIPAAVETPAPVPAAPKVLPTTGPDGKPLSKLDMIRMQGGAKR